MPERILKTIVSGLLSFVVCVVFFSHGAMAVVGGTADNGPLSRSTVMILTSNGGVCSAIVLARDVVLTAGHCAAGATDYRIHYRDTGGEPVLMEPEAKSVHPEYSAGAEKTRKRSIDLALFKLGQPLPARFAPASLSGRQPRKGEHVSIGGYGLAQTGDSRSSGVFRTAQLEVSEPYGPGKFLVWASGKRTAGACNGDSGGPLVQNGLVFAVTAWATNSRAAPCGDLTQGIFVGPQRGWIDRTLSDWSRNARWQD